MLIRQIATPPSCGMPASRIAPPVPEDGEALEFNAAGEGREVELLPGSGPQPGFQKWLVNQIPKVM